MVTKATGVPAWKGSRRARRRRNCAHNPTSREKFRRFCGTAGTTASRLNFRAAGDLFSRVSAIFFCWCFFVVFLLFFVVFCCCFCCFLGVFSCFLVFLFCFSRVSAKFFGGLFFAVPQGIPAISPLDATKIMLLDFADYFTIFIDRNLRNLRK